MLDTACDFGCHELISLKYTNKYLVNHDSGKAFTDSQMCEFFDRHVGLYHNSFSIGATVIEKHFTLSRADSGVDCPFPMEPAELRMLVEEMERA